jgi:hypothetical protein
LSQSFKSPTKIRFGVKKIQDTPCTIAEFLVFVLIVALEFQNFGYEFLRLGNMFEGDFAGMFNRKFLLMSMGGSRGSCVYRPGSEEPHWLEQ